MCFFFFLREACFCGLIPTIYVCNGFLVLNPYVFVLF